MAIDGIRPELPPVRTPEPTPLTERNLEARRTAPVEQAPPLPLVEQAPPLPPADSGRGQTVDISV